MSSVDCFPCGETNHIIVSPPTSSLKIEFDPLEIELVLVKPMTLLKLDSLPEDMMGVMLQLTVFVESKNKPVLVNLHMRVIYWISGLLKVSKHTW